METFLDSHSREKCVYKEKFVSTLIKGKHDMYNDLNENARLDENLHQFFLAHLTRRGHVSYCHHLASVVVIRRPS